MSPFKRHKKTVFQLSPSAPPPTVPPGLSDQADTLLFVEHAHLVRRLNAKAFAFAVQPHEVAASKSHLTDAFLEGCDSPKLTRTSLPLESFRSSRKAADSPIARARELRDRFDGRADRSLTANKPDPILKHFPFPDKSILFTFGAAPDNLGERRPARRVDARKARRLEHPTSLASRALPSPAESRLVRIDGHIIVSRCHF